MGIEAKAFLAAKCDRCHIYYCERPEQYLMSLFEDFASMEITLTENGWRIGVGYIYCKTCTKEYPCMPAYSETDFPKNAGGTD